jgi:hypothetical protein
MNRKLSAKMVISNSLGQHESYFIFKTLPKTSFIDVKVHQKRGVIFCPPPFPHFFEWEKIDNARCEPLKNQ